ncbi:MAG: glutamate racemase [Bacteroidota bacterium]
MKKTPIGVFDSGFGGLTVLKQIVNHLPEYDYVYLGDNARAPYGNRSFETVYEYTLESVKHLFAMGCELVILACNTASAKALRNIQQRDLPNIDPDKRVLGVIRPTAEVIGKYTKTGHVGVLGTPGTVKSESYPIEISKLFPEITVHQEACPMWVPLVENGEVETEAADYFVNRHLQTLLKADERIDAIILGCTHYPLLRPVIDKFIPAGLTVLEQGEIVALSLKNYLERHTALEQKCSKNGTIEFFTTDYPANFDVKATQFFGQEVRSTHLALQAK